MRSLKGSKPLLDLQPKQAKPKKLLPLVQAYSKKYFNTKLKPLIKASYEDHLKDANAGLVAQMKPLEYYNKEV